MLKSSFEVLVECEICKSLKLLGCYGFKLIRVWFVCYGMIVLEIILLLVYVNIMNGIWYL